MASSCASLNCYGTDTCCVVSNGQPYCQVSSQCRDNPIWESVVIPATIFLLALCILIVVVYKLCKKSHSYMQVSNFAKQEV